MTPICAPHNAVALAIEVDKLLYEYDLLETNANELRTQLGIMQYEYAHMSLWRRLQFVILGK